MLNLNLSPSKVVTSLKKAIHYDDLKQRVSSNNNITDSGDQFLADTTSPPAAKSFEVFRPNKPVDSKPQESSLFETAAADEEEETEEIGDAIDLQHIPGESFQDKLKRVIEASKQPDVKIQLKPAFAKKPQETKSPESEA